MDGKELVSGAAYDVYMDIKKRTNGEIYFGVVGPVRTGKSTFIKRFMELCVLPSMKDDNKRKRAQDELPQSSGGTTVMTVEPKFIPSEAALISPFEGINMKVRLVDCVGFMVEGANGHLDNGKERMVKTPWDTKEIAFSKAAEIGTKKVINDHSTIGIVVTTDGSFTEIDRTNYIVAEKKTINELKKINKPFVVILNSDKPYATKTRELAVSMSADYEVPVIPVNCDQLKNEDVNNILKEVLKQFAVTQIDFFAPEWTQVLPDEHWLKKELMQVAGEVLEGINTIKDADNYKYSADNEYIKKLDVTDVSLSEGRVSVKMSVDANIYYGILSELTGTKILNEYELISTIRDLALRKKEYESVSDAVTDVNMSGFGVVTPVRSAIELEEPVVIKNGNKYGVKIKAKVPSVNMLKTQINVEIAPIVGSEQQAKDLVDYIESAAQKEQDGIWNTNIFGKSIEQIVEDGMNAKINQMTDSCQQKLQDALKKIINDSNVGIVCIII